MRRAVLALSFALVLACPPQAFALALGNSSLRTSLTVGVGGSSASEEYGGLMQLPEVALAVGMRVGGALAGSVWSFVDVGYFQLGRGQFIGRTTWTDPVMEQSSAVTAMVGLELAERDQRWPARF